MEDMNAATESAMLSPLRLAAVAFHSLRLAWRPGHLPSIFGLVGAMNTPAQLAAMRAHLSQHPRAAAALQAPFHLSLDVDALAALPEGSLGRTFADFVRERGIEPAVLTDQALGEQDWIPMHLYEVHDVWHIVLDVGTDVVSEVHLLSFMLAQLPQTRMAPLAIGVALLRAAIGHRDFTPADVQRAIVAGTTRGRGAELIFGIDWSQHWERPVEEVRAELGLGRECASSSVEHVAA